MVSKRNTVYFKDADNQDDDVFNATSDGKVIDLDEQQFQQIREKEHKRNSKLLEYNDRTYKSYVSKGFSAPDNLDYQERNFLSKIQYDLSGKHTPEIKIKVTKIVRLRAIDYNTPKHEIKEYVYWFENWYGNDWQGIKIAPVTDHIEGLYQEVKTENIVKANRVIGQKIAGKHNVYYIPFSKEAIDKIIERSDLSYKENIIYCVKQGDYRHDQYSYDQFVNLSYEDCVKLMNVKGGAKFNPQVLEEALAARNKNKKNKKEE